MCSLIRCIGINGNKCMKRYYKNGTNTKLFHDNKEEKSVTQKHGRTSNLKSEVRSVLTKMKRKQQDQMRNRVTDSLR